MLRILSPTPAAAPKSIHNIEFRGSGGYRSCSQAAWRVTILFPSTVWMSSFKGPVQHKSTILPVRFLTMSLSLGPTSTHPEPWPLGRPVALAESTCCMSMDMPLHMSMGTDMPMGMPMGIPMVVKLGKDVLWGIPFPTVNIG